MKTNNANQNKAKQNNIREAKPNKTKQNNVNPTKQNKQKQPETKQKQHTECENTSKTTSGNKTKQQTK